LSGKDLEEKIERDKIFLLGAGVCFFMSLIFVLWLFNFNSFWGNEAALPESKEDSQFLETLSDLGELKDQVGGDLEEIKAEIRKLQEQGEKGTTTENKLKEEDIEVLKEKIENNRKP